MTFSVNMLHSIFSYIVISVPAVIRTVYKYIRLVFITHGYHIYLRTFFFVDAAALRRESYRLF